MTKSRTIRFLTNPRSRVHPLRPFVAFLRFFAYPQDHNVDINRGFFSIDKNNFSNFIEPMIRLQINVAMYENSMNGTRQSSVAVVPLYSMDRQHVTLDTTALYAVYNLNRENKIARSLRNTANRDIIWDSAFTEMVNGERVYKLPRQFLE